MTKGVHLYDNTFQNYPSLQRYDGCFFIKQQVAIEPAWMENNGRPLWPCEGPGEGLRGQARHSTFTQSEWKNIPSALSVSWRGWAKHNGMSNVMLPHVLAFTMNTGGQFFVGLQLLKEEHRHCWRRPSDRSPQKIHGSPVLTHQVEHSKADCMELNYRQDKLKKTWMTNK